MDPSPLNPRVTELLQLPVDRREAHESELLELVYEDLHRLAAAVFQSESQRHTLQPTVLLHDAWMKLGLGEIEVRNRGHFYAIAGRAMRQVLVDHARRRRAQKRGEGGAFVTLTAEVADATSSASEEHDILELDQALNKFAETYDRQAKVAELRYLAGLTVEEVALALDTSEKTVRRDWRFARSWLGRELSGGDSPPELTES
ncbi:MAG: ECF-type sigma factor [Planctomycetota bacterium]